MITFFDVLFSMIEKNQKTGLDAGQVKTVRKNHKILGLTLLPALGFVLVRDETPRLLAGQTVRISSVRLAKILIDFF
jgi:hypothetical protein